MGSFRWFNGRMVKYKKYLTLIVKKSYIQTINLTEA